MNLDKRNLQVSLIKAIPFAFILGFFYLHDFTRWYSVLLTYPWIVILIFALSIAIFGVVVRRRLIVTYSDLSVGSWYLGIPLLLAGFGLYMYGTTSSAPYLAWYQFESAICFILCYISLSYDWRIVRSTGLLFLVMALAYPSPLLSTVGTQNVFYGTALVMVILFLIFAGRNFRLIVAPLIAYVFVFAYSAIPSGLGTTTIFIIPLSFAVYLHPRLRRSLSDGRSANVACRHLWPLSDGSGFCSACGRKYLPSTRLPKLGLAGLVLIFLVLMLLSFPLVEIPVLQLQHGSVPQYELYNYKGVSGVALPSTPEGWQRNSSTTLTLSGDLYAVKNVYVPISNPNKSNYTIYYELSQNSRTNMSNAWGNVFGWNRLQTPQSLAGLFGYLVVYTPRNTSSGGSTLIVYSGSEHMTFLQPFGGQTLTVQMSFTRNFSSSIDVNTAASMFISDLQNSWQMPLSKLDVASTWSGFLFSMYSLILSIYSFAVIIASSSLVVFGSYRAMRSDSKTDHYLEAASDLDERKWFALSSIIGFSSSHPMTQLEMEDLLSRRAMLRSEEVPKLVEDFERAGLLKKVIWEKGHEVYLGWRTTIEFGFI